MADFAIRRPQFISVQLFNASQHKFVLLYIPPNPLPGNITGRAVDPLTCQHFLAMEDTPPV